jgi:hypothetical protein
MIVYLALIMFCAAAYSARHPLLERDSFCRRYSRRQRGGLSPRDRLRLNNLVSDRVTHKVAD